MNEPKVYEVLKSLKHFSTEKYKKIISNYPTEIYSNHDANNLISKSITSGKPLMVARIGETELSCIRHFLKYENNVKWPKKIKYKMSNNAGFFPSSDEMLTRFSRFYLDNIRNIDILGVWYNYKEDYVAKKYCIDAKLVGLSSLEPYYHKDPWSKYLANKKVLVIHPYAETISKQYNNNRDKIFEDSLVLPKFELKILKAVQSIANNKTPYNNWFEAYDSMCEKIDQIDFDIALIGAGAYGLSLASYIKTIGKQAIHIGGATQIMFGIKGKRWDNHKYISKLYNSYWTRPLESDKPKNFDQVEGGCYW